MSYAALYTKSNFSFLEGASHPEELVEAAHKMGLAAIAITDRDGLYGMVRAYLRARELGIKLIVGAEISVALDRSGLPIDPEQARDGVRGPIEKLVLLARNREGYANLCRLVTRGRRRCDKGLSRVTWGEVCSHAFGLVCLWPGWRHEAPMSDTRNDPVGRRVGGQRTAQLGPSAPLEDLLCAFDDEVYALATRHRTPEDLEHEAWLRACADPLGISVVAGVEVIYHTVARRRLQDVLTCIRYAVTIHDAGNMTQPNDARALKTPHAFAALFEDVPAEVARTIHVADQCNFSLADLTYDYPNVDVPEGISTSQWLRELTYDGARTRYRGEVPEDVVAQLDRELDLIEELGYGGYFLTMWEIVDFCRHHEILCQGRGSAANSAVCYCLGITAVDPVRMDLLFERFLSRERDEPPDIDLDIAHERREEVIQWVYERYGRDRAAMVAIFVRYRGRSAVRDVGKVLGIPETALDRLAKLLSWSHAPDAQTLAQVGLDPDLPAYEHLLTLVAEIRDFPRHVGIHPGGFLLGSVPVHDLVPIENASMEDRTVLQWDKYDVEGMNLFKVDLLGLGALTLVDKAFRLIADHRGPQLDMASLPPDDPATYDMICAADTVGVFQIESRAQMAMLPRLRPRHFYDLVIEVSIVRPGPIAGDMVHPYLRRRNGSEPVVYPHESLEPVLSRTLGVPLFQEQVMKLAMIAGGYTPGEADQLRRDMAAWRSSGRIERHRDRLIGRMQERGISKEFAQRVFEQIRGFGEYGFPESHAASFALIVYATAWLRCHYPVEFTCAILNAQPMGFYSVATLVDDAKRHGVTCRPIDVNHSDWDCTLEWNGDPSGSDFAVRMGFRFLKGGREDQWLRIDASRQESGAFVDVEDFARRVRMNDRSLSNLAQAGAFETCVAGVGRRGHLWQVPSAVARRDDTLVFTDVERQPSFAELDKFDTVAWDYLSAAHSVRGHPMSSFRDDLERRGLCSAADTRTMPHEKWVNAVGLVITKQRPGTASGVMFMTLEDETGFMNLVVWPNVFERFNVLIKTANCLGVSGRIQSQEGVVHIIVTSFWKPHLDREPIETKSRDFR